MKYKIEKNTVQETLVIPLYSRKLCTELYPNLFQDETAVRLIDQIDYDFSEAEKNSRSLMQRFGAGVVIVDLLHALPRGVIPAHVASLRAERFRVGLHIRIEVCRELALFCV